MSITWIYGYQREDDGVIYGKPANYDECTVWHVADEGNILNGCPPNARCRFSRRQWRMHKRSLEGQRLQQFTVELGPLPQPPHGQYCPKCLASLRFRFSGVQPMTQVDYNHPYVVCKTTGIVHQDESCCRGKKLANAKKLAAALAESHDSEFVVCRPVASFSRPKPPVQETKIR